MVQKYQTDEENQPQALGWTPGPQFWANRGPKSISKFREFPKLKTKREISYRFGS